MRRAIFWGIIGMVLPLVSYSHEQAEEPEKIYVHPNQVSIGDQGIFAFIKDQWIPVTAVYADVFGVYIVGVANYPYTPWICRVPGCNYNNNGADTTCRRWDARKQQLCGGPRPPG